MKKMSLFCLIWFVANIASASPDAQVDRIYDLVGVKKFIFSLKRIKEFKSVEEIDELDYELKKYYKQVYLWRKFDEVQFEKELRSKIIQNFTAQELSELEALFTKPFPAKVVRAIVIGRDVFGYSQELIDSKYITVSLPESRKLLMNNFYLLHGMEIQKEKAIEVLQSYAESKVSYITLYNKVTHEKFFTNPVILGERSKNTKDFVLNYLAKDLSSFRHYELREYMRVMKSSKTAQRFLQLYANYHFLYLINFIEAYKIPKELLQKQHL